VVGSLSPWVEAILLAHDVGQIVTLEYPTLECDHPKVSKYIFKNNIAGKTKLKIFGLSQMIVTYYLHNC
jgi:hypothetical protein